MQGVIQVLQQEGVIPRPDEAEDVHLRDVSLLRYTPEVFIGRDTFKLFDGHGIAYGTIVDYDETHDGQPIWGVLYDDGTREDYNINVTWRARNFSIERVHICIASIQQLSDLGLTVFGLSAAAKPAEHYRGKLAQVRRGPRRRRVLVRHRHENNCKY